MSFIGIGGQAEMAEFEDFIARTGTDGFPQLADSDGALWKAFGTGGRSTFLFINDDGTRSLTTYGSLDESGLTEGVQELIDS